MPDQAIPPGQGGPGRIRLRDLPAVDAVLHSAAASALLDRFGRQSATDAVSAVLAEAQDGLMTDAVPSTEAFAGLAFARLAEEDQSDLRPLFNLTGTVLHPSLGKAVLAEAAIEAAMAAMWDPVALDYDLFTGKNGDRDDHIRTLLCELTGAEDATVVNNGAAAMLLALNTLALGREAIISRGELADGGDGFRVPDIMASAGTRPVEVGTTNCTHARDYRAGLTPRTGVILKVNTANYRIEGFTAAVDGAALAVIADDAGVALVNDLGSGALIDLSGYGLPKEPIVRDAVADGAGLVIFSGDRLLGGPQAGFIVGKADLIAAINRNPMKRALRADKIRLAAIEATLKLYRDPDRLAARLPTLHLLARPQADIAALADSVQPGVAQAVGPGFTVSVCACRSQIGSGALPMDSLPSAGLRITPQSGGGGLDALAAALRGLEHPVIGRVEDGALVLDLRCLTDAPAFLSTIAALDSEGLA
jgi:L-seryl-tRNA(Ser) seleniumtransferase